MTLDMTYRSSLGMLWSTRGWSLPIDIALDDGQRSTKANVGREGNAQSSEVQMPFAHASAPVPQLWPWKGYETDLSQRSRRSPPFGLVMSVGHVDEFPTQNSGASHLSSLDFLHICVFGANWQPSVQQAEPLGSHTAPALNLQVCESQHVELLPEPGSHSSPASTMPFPHICIDITWRVGSGSRMQDVFVWPPPIPIINEPSKLRHGQRPWTEDN